MSRLNKSCSRISFMPVRATKSRSSSVSSVTDNMLQETASMNMMQLDSNSDAATVRALVKCLQVTGVKNDLNTLKSEIKETEETLQESMTILEDKVDKILSILTGMAPEPPPISVIEIFAEESMLPFIIGGAQYNNLSTWIRTSITNQKVGGLEWDFSKSFNKSENMIVTKNIIDFVGAQIVATTKLAWTEAIPYIELERKVRNVFRRQLDLQRVSSADRIIRHKKSVRKSRRNTKCKHRKNIMANEEYGQQMRDMYGNEVEKLLIEQLQSDEENTDSELGMTQKTGRLNVIIPDWRTSVARKCSEREGIKGCRKIQTRPYQASIS